MVPIVTIRPAPGDAGTVAAGRAAGLTVLSHPLFSIEPVAWQAPDPGGFDAVLLGSANAVRHGGPRLAALTALPALCVGETTATAARDAGFAIAATGTGGLQSVLPIASERGLARLLRLAGEAHVPLALPQGMRAETRVVYRVVDHPIDDLLAAILDQGAVVLLHSGEAATHFAREVDRRGLDRRHIALACLAPRIADRAGEGWRALSTAASVEDGALLALAAQMCQA